MKPGMFLVGGHPPVVQAGLLVIFPEEYIEALTLGILMYIYIYKVEKKCCAEGVTEGDNKRQL